MTSPDTVTGELARFLSDLTGRVDDRLLAAASTYLFDTMACTVYGAATPWAGVVRDQALATGGSGPCTVIGAAPAAAPVTTMTTTAAMAALANGTAAHSFELDDVHEEAISHPGAVVVPAALAVAQEVGASGHDLLEAIVIGYEAMGRAGIAVGPARHMLSGFHPTSMSGVFGAAAAAGRLLGLDGAAMTQAFGVATSLASGTMEFAASGGMAKRIHAGRAAEGGVLAARLVARGFEGAGDGLAGRYGFCRVFTDAPRVELLTEDLGRRWMCDEITIKPYAACSDIHPMIEAAARIRVDEFNGRPVSPDEVAEIRATGPTKAAEQNNLDGTVSIMAAQYSAQFNIAAALLGDPTDPATYTPAVLTDPVVAAMQSKVVSITADPEFDATYAWKMGGTVTVTTTDGRVLADTVHGQKGSMHNPLSIDELAAKATRLVDDAERLQAATTTASVCRPGGVPALADTVAGSRRHGEAGPDR